AGLTDLRLRFTRAINASAFERGYAEVAVFSLTAAFLLWVHVPKRQFQIDYWQKDLLPIHQAAESFRKHPEWWSDPKTKILIVSDPFKDMHWAPIFIGILTARNMDLQIHRLPDMNPKPDEAILRTFPVALQWQENQFVRVDSAAVPVLR
ncbi:MAG: hypothetical protein H7Y20_01760, partial [Bryobacteraceae bacterium]|nr:hypothetical protein [Bryobacteraceae bacterium]